MPKDIKGNAGRKPPEPSLHHDEIDDWIHHQMPDLQSLLTELDESIRASLPGLHFALQRKRAYYGLPEYGWVIEIAAYAVSVNVVFLGGADFEPPPPLGTADRTRYVKVTDVAQARESALRDWIHQAGRTPGWR